MTTEFTSNEFRLYHNSGLKLQEEIDLKLIETPYLELVELIDLFSYKESDEKILQMQDQKKELIKLSGDKIHLYQELKSQRVITNELEKRIVTKTSTLVTLYEGARRLDTVEFEDLYKSIVLFFSKTLDVKEAAIYLKDNNKWKLKRSLGWENEDSWPKEYALNDGLVGLSGSGGKVLNIKNFLGKDVERQKIQVTDSQPQLDIKRECLMAGPLKKGENGNVIGVFSIQAIPLLSLNSATVNLFSFLLNWASRSLGTAYFFEEMKKQEILDPELEIYSFRYFETRFKQYPKNKTLEKTLSCCVCSIALIYIYIYIYMYVYIYIYNYI